MSFAGECIMRAMTTDAGSPVRVGFFVSTLATGGAERQLEHIILNLDRASFAPFLYTLRAPGAIGDALIARGVPATTGLAPGRLPPPWLPIALARQLARDGIGCLYCLDHTNAVVLASAAAKLAGGLPLLVAVHTMGQWDRPSLPRPIRAVLGGVTRLIAIAESQRDYLVNEEHIPRAKIVVIRNGIPPLDPATLPSKREARAALGLDAADGPVIGIVAMLRPEKGHEVFFDAARRLLEGSPRAVFLVVGDGPRRAELEAMVRGVGIAARVKFLGRRDDVPAVFRALDLSVLASHARVETLPLSQMEAMSLEVPVVATRVGALHELVEDGVEGRLVPPGDPVALAGAMAEMLGDPARLAAAGAAARRKVLGRFTIERVARETEALIREVRRA